MSTTRWHKQLLLTATATALLVLSGCAERAAGPPVTQQRAVNAFHSVDLRGTADVTVAIGAGPSLAITADAETLKNTTASVRNGVLVIDNEPNWHWLGTSGKVTVQISTPTLNSLSINGAGNVVVSGASGSGLALALQGAGNIKASGQTSALNARINGAGNMDLSRLVAGDATVAVNGTGSLKVHATVSLEATVNGVGSITYAGAPQRVDSHVNGVGSIAPAR